MIDIRHWKSSYSRFISQASNVLRLHSLIVALGFSGASCIYLTSLVEFKLHDGNLSVCMNRWFTVDTDNRVVFDFQLFCFRLSMVHVYHVVFELTLYSCIPVQRLLLNSFWMMFSLTLAYFPPFQTILSEVSIRFHLMRDVNLSVCLKWWLTFDTDNPVVFVISQASSVQRLHTLVFAWVSPARHVFLSNFLLNSFWINCSLPVACFLSFQTFLSNVSIRFYLLRDVIPSVCLKWWLTFTPTIQWFSLYHKLQLCYASTRWSLLEFLELVLYSCLVFCWIRFG